MDDDSESGRTKRRRHSGGGSPAPRRSSRSTGRISASTPETAVKIASAFGAGVAKSGEICGAVSGRSW